MKVRGADTDHDPERRSDMPIIEKIDRARLEYDRQLKEFQKLAAALGPDNDGEQELISMLAKMIEIKTEYVILGRVEAHRRNTEQPAG